jgi:hypothetical protein
LEYHAWRIFALNQHAKEAIENFRQKCKEGVKLPTMSFLFVFFQLVDMLASWMQPRAT